MKSTAFVQTMFRNYYTQNYSLQSNISKIEQREFGFIMFEGWMQRHKSFRQTDELDAFLKNAVPSDGYYSCAYYESPEAEMDKKGWLGADLIFDIDADHIPTSCNKIHDTWTCENCGFAGRGITPEKCPRCNSEKFTANTWPCEVCLDFAKTETLKLLEILTQDFGFSDKEIRVFFSGHRGYHVSVENDAIKTLDAVARKEIVDYVLGLGMNIAFKESDKKKAKKYSFSEMFSNIKLHKRLMQGLQTFIVNANAEDFQNIELKKNAIEALMRNRNLILENLQKTGNVFVKGVGDDSWKKIIEHVIKLQSAKIDTVVTTDTHRLIRLTDTLHGKTGLKKVEISISDLNIFDPFKDAVAFEGGKVAVHVSDAPKFKLSGEILGPYKNERVELPTAAALFLVCKGRAEVVTF